jgi:glutaredoxin 3
MAEIIVYTRKMCGFCTAAKSLLSGKKASFKEFDGTFDSKIRQEMMQKSGRTTFPQIFIDGVHVGGCDELHDLDRRGKLDGMLKKGA